jgi:hypothetical protein
MPVCELIALTCASAVFDTGAHVRCHGKGRKERITPLRREARATLRVWREERGGTAGDPLLFPGPKGRRLSREEVLKFLPPGSDDIPEEAFRSQPGRLLFELVPQRFGRARLTEELANQQRAMAEFERRYGDDARVT